MPDQHGLMDMDVFVKNVGAATINLPEIGGYDLEPDEEINMMDETLPHGHYNDAQAVLRAFNDLTGTVLYQQREAGNLEYRVVPAVG